MTKAVIDFYNIKASTYFEQTVAVDPHGFLGPFADLLLPGSRVLDVGCGSGRDLLWLSRRGYLVKGLERSSKLAELARKHAGCEVVVGDFESWDFVECPVEGILLVGALVHTPHEDLGRVLRHISRGLVQTGKILLTLKEGEGSSKSTDGRVFYLWQDLNVRGLLKDLGFNILHFDRLRSALRKEDVWLTYVLEKENGGAEPS